MTTSKFAKFADFTCDEFADTLADFLEREVREATRAAMEGHALGCTVCGPLLADLRKLRMDAASLPALEPSRDLWSGIAERIETPVVELRTDSRSGGRAVGRWSSRVTVGVAAAALIVITATITHELTKRSVANVGPVAVNPVVVTPPPAPPRTTARESAVVASAPRRRGAEPPSRLVSNKPSVEDTYASEIKRLRIIVNERRGGLDSTTVAVIDKNLNIIDEAIANCRAALKKDPHSRFLTESLNDALDTKVQLLRTAAALPTRM